jgi:hypothetical protein
MTKALTLDEARERYRWNGTDSTFEGVAVAWFRKLSGKRMVVLEDDRGLLHIYPDTERLWNVTDEVTPQEIAALSDGAGWGTTGVGDRMEAEHRPGEARTPAEAAARHGEALRSRDATIADLRAQLDEKDRRIAKAIDELHGVGAGHSDVFAVIDILDPAAALSQDKEASS